MDTHDQPGLFDVPDQAQADPPRRTVRGNNRQMWTRVATAEVTITDPEALQAAVAQAEAGAVTIGLDRETDTEEDTGAEAGDEAEGNEDFNALAWLVWPTDGLEVLLEGGAVRILSVESAVDAHSADRGTISLTVTVKLHDVEELRRIAAETRPEAATQITESLPVAWECAADPFAPLNSIPGIAWQPGTVETHHVPARQGTR